MCGMSQTGCEGAPSANRDGSAVTAGGKLLFRGGMPLHIRGVTYGTFGPDANGDLFPPPERVTADFRAIAANGFNAVRTYTPPPRWLAEIAADCGLELLIGLTWEQHIAFLADRATATRRPGVRPATRATTT